MEQKLDAAIARATRLVKAWNFEDAADVVRHAERRCPDHLGIQRLYVEAISSLGGKDAAAKDRALIRTIFQRLIHRPQRDNPEPHTQEEADRYGQEDAREHARVVRLVGFDPMLWPDDPPGVTRITPATRKKPSMLATIFTVVSMVIGLVASLTMIVMFLAGSANSDPIALRQMKWMAASVILVQFMALGGSIGLLIVDHRWMACGTGLFPAIFVIILTIVLVRIEW